MLKLKINFDSKYSMSNRKECGSPRITSNKEFQLNAGEENFISEGMHLVDVAKEVSKRHKGYSYADITKKTVLGVLCRLLGDVRRLNDILSDQSSYVHELSEALSFSVLRTDYQNETIRVEKEKPVSIPGTSCGVIKKVPVLYYNNQFSEIVLSALECTTYDDVVKYVNKLNSDNNFFLNNKYQKNINVQSFLEHLKLSGSEISSDIKRMRKEQGLPSTGKGSETLSSEELRLKEMLGVSEEAKLNNVSALLIYFTIDKMMSLGLFKEEVAEMYGKNMRIPGLSRASGYISEKEIFRKFSGKYYLTNKTIYFTDLPPKAFDYKVGFVMSKKKPVAARLGIIKESGALSIELNLPEERALYFKEIIENSGVNVFQMGKKGLAYVEEISLCM